MHLGIVLEHSDPARGGLERFAHELGGRLRLHGHRVSFACRTGPDSRFVPGYPAALRPLYFSRLLVPRLRRSGAERLIAFPPVPGCDFYQPHGGLLASQGAPVLETMAPLRGLLGRANLARRLHFAALRSLEGRAVAPPARILAIAPAVAEEARRRYPAAAPPLLLRLGVDLDRYRPAGETERRRVRSSLGVGARGPLLLFVAHNFALKGLQTAIRALPALPGAILAVAGRGGRLRPRRLAAALGVAHRLLFVDPRADLPPLFRSADLLVHPTHGDAASRVVLEALASGVAPVTTRRDGNGDLAEAGGGGLLDRPGDPEALARTVRELLGRPGEERRARARAEAERWPASRMLDRMVEALTRPPSPPASEKGERFGEPVAGLAVE